MSSTDNDKSYISEDSQIKSTGDNVVAVEAARMENMTIDDKHGTQQDYRVYPIRFYGLALIALLNIGSSLSWLCVAPIPEYAQTFFNNVSLTAINWFSNVFMLVFIFIGPVSSFIYDHYSIKMGLVIGGNLQTVGSWFRFFSSFVPQHPNRLALALIGQIICALGQPFFLSAATPYAALWFSADERGAATTVAGLANAVGMALASLIVPAVVTNADEMWLGFLIIACINTAFAIPTIFIPRKPKTPPSFSASNSQERQLPLGKSIWLLFTNYSFLILLLAFGILAGLFSTIASLLTQFVTPYGVSVDDAGYLGVALIVAGIVGAVTTGIFIDKTKLHKPVLKVYVPVLACMQLAMLYEVKSDNYVPLIIVCAIYGFFAFSLLPIALELSVECSYPVSESVSSPLLWLASQICGLIFLSSMDALREDNGNPPGNMRRALVMATGLSMPMILFAWLYNSRNKRMEAEGGYQEPHIFRNLYSKLIR